MHPHHEPVVAVTNIAFRIRHAKFESIVNTVLIDFADVVVHAAGTQHRASKTQSFRSFRSYDTNPDKLYINKFDATLDDKPAPITGNARYNEVRIRQLGEREFQVLEQLDGDVVIGQYWCFSEDASTLMRWGVGKAPDGGSKAFFETFGRVAD